MNYDRTFELGFKKGYCGIKMNETQQKAEQETTLVTELGGMAVEYAGDSTDWNQEAVADEDELFK